MFKRLWVMFVLGICIVFSAFAEDLQDQKAHKKQSLLSLGCMGCHQSVRQPKKDMFRKNQPTSVSKNAKVKS